VLCVLLSGGARAFGLKSNHPQTPLRACPTTHREQEKMNYYYRGSSWHLGERYTDMIKTLFLAMFYMTLLPSGCARV
jgi:hypothetical protein